MMEHQAVGCGKTTTSTQFCKGQSGNPKGRPKNCHHEIPYDGVLGQMRTIREDGRTRRVTAAEAFLLQLTQKSLSGDSAEARFSLEVIEAARAKQTMLDDPLHIIINVVGAGHSIILDTLGLAIKKYPTDQARVRWALNPWIVEATLSRLGDRRLSQEEQREVWSNTRTPHEVQWPEWWTVRE